MKRSITKIRRKALLYALAIDLGGTKCAAAIVDRNGNLIRRRSAPVDLSSPSAPVLQIAALAKDLADSIEPREAFVAIGIAVPGLVRQDGTVWAPNLPGWQRMPLARRLQRLLQVPVVVESDRNAAILGELWRGAARGNSDAIVLLIGTGIGAGILSGSKLLRGAHELSGCAGWLVISDEATPQSRRLGTLESQAAGPAVAQVAKKLLQSGRSSTLSRLDAAKLTALDVADAARAGDGLSQEVFNDVGRLLGLATANLVSILDPNVIIISGGLAAAADLYMNALKKAMLEKAQPIAAKQVKITVSKLGESANLLGCARLAWDMVSKAD